MRVVSVFGAFEARVLVEMTRDEAADHVGDDFGSTRPAYVIDSVEREMAEFARRDARLAESALASVALAMAYEISDPFNSATSKSMCAARLQDALRELRELAPAEEAKDGVDEIAERRAQRRAGGATAKG